MSPVGDALWVAMNRRVQQRSLGTHGVQGQKFHHTFRWNVLIIHNHRYYPQNVPTGHNENGPGSVGMHGVHGQKFHHTARWNVIMNHHDSCCNDAGAFADVVYMDGKGRYRRVKNT